METPNAQSAQVTAELGDAQRAPSLRLEVFASPTLALRGGQGSFGPVTSTLILGEHGAVLVDAQFTNAQVDALGDLIEASGRKLQAIYITHGHVDHYFGLGRLLPRFPEARAVATREVADYIAQSRDAEVASSEPLFNDLTLPGDNLPAALEDNVLILEGHELRAIDVGQSDINPSTVLHVPSIGAVIAGDVVYNGIHQYLALGGTEEWDAWIASIDLVERLAPKLLVAGHKQANAPDDDITGIINGTRDYIRDFAATVAAGGTQNEIIATMTGNYPNRSNPTALAFSAMAAVARRDASASQPGPRSAVRS